LKKPLEKKQNRSKRMKKNLLAALLFPLCLLGKPAIAEEIQPKPAIELSLEKRLSKPSISIIFDSGIETEQEETAYENSFAGFYSGYIWTSQNIPPAEKLELSKIMNSIKNGGIDSYRSLVESLKNSSENQKLLLLAIISNSLYAGSYDSALLVNGTKVASQEDFFDKLQDFLATNNPNSLGVCRHFASHIEQLANDVGLRAAAVTGTTMGGGHAYNVLKTENGTAIIDGGHILIADTKNIEKILEAYQKDANSIAFQHLFFEDSKFKYRLITKDGRNFL